MGGLWRDVDGSILQWLLLVYVNLKGLGVLGLVYFHHVTVPGFGQSI